MQNYFKFGRLSKCKCYLGFRFFGEAIGNEKIEIKRKRYWKNNVQGFLMDLKEKLNLQTKEDWNSVTLKDICNNGGRTLLKNYSLYDLKCMGNPENEAFITKPKKYWENQQNLDNFLLELKNKLNLENFDDWNKLTKKEIQKIGGTSLLNLFSINEIKSLGFPEGKEKFLQRKKKLDGFWENKENVLKFLEDLSISLNLKTSDDWNDISQKDIISNGGGSLLQSYSILELKKLGCNEIITNQTKKIPKFCKKENISNFLNELKEKLNLKSIDDWNSIDVKTIKEFGGGSLLQYYSIYQIKCFACPEGKFIFSKRNHKKALVFGIKKRISIIFLMN